MQVNHPAGRNQKEKGTVRRTVPFFIVTEAGSLKLATSDAFVTTVHIHTTSFHLNSVYHALLDM